MSKPCCGVAKRGRGPCLGATTSLTTDPALCSCLLLPGPLESAHSCACEARAHGGQKWALLPLQIISLGPGPEGCKWMDV